MTTKKKTTKKKTTKKKTTKKKTTRKKTTRKKTTRKKRIRKATSKPGNRSEQEQKQRTDKGTWKKGQSGNPSGRPKGAGIVRELAQQYTEDAIRTLADIMLRGEKEAVRVKAAEVLLDRAWGKAPQAVELTGPGGDDPVTEITVKFVKPGGDQ